MTATAVLDARVLVLNKNRLAIDVMKALNAIHKVWKERALFLDIETGRTHDFESWVVNWEDAIRLARVEESRVAAGSGSASRQPQGQQGTGKQVQDDGEYAGQQRIHGEIIAQLRRALKCLEEMRGACAQGVICSYNSRLFTAVTTIREQGARCLTIFPSDFRKPSGTCAGRGG